MPLDPSARKLSAILGAGILLAVAGLSAYRVSERSGMASLGAEAYHRPDLFAAAIDGIVNRYAHVIPLNPEVVALVRQPGDQRLKQAVNDHLERFNS